MQSKVLDDSVASALLSEIRQELDEHLEVINENTDEIEANFSYLINFEKKIKFLEQRLERMEKLFVQTPHTGEGSTSEQKKRTKISITDAEQEVFLIIYNSPKAVEYQELCARLRRSETYVRYQINGLIAKRIPITRHIINKKTFFALDPEFKNVQCRENIVNLSRTLTLDCFDQSVVWL